MNIVELQEKLSKDIQVALESKTDPLEIIGALDYLKFQLLGKIHEHALKCQECSQHVIKTE